MDNKLRTNLILNTLYHFLVPLVPFVTAPYLGRVLGPQRIGEYTYVQSVVAYFGYFAMLGLSNYGSREIAKVRDSKSARSKLFVEIYSMQLITAGISVLLYIIYLLFVRLQYWPIEICMIAWVASNLLDIGWYYMGREKFKAIVLRNVIIKAANVVLIFAFVKCESDFIKYVLIMSGGQFASQVIFWLTVSKEIRFEKASWIDVKRHFKPNILLFIPVMAASIYRIMDKIMLGAISSSNQLAYYEYADKIIQIPGIVFSAMGVVMLSRTSSMQGSVDDKEKSKKLIYYSLDFIMLLGIAAAFGLAAIANELVYLYYGAEFLASGQILLLLTPVIILNGWDNVLRMQYIIPENKNRSYIIATVVGAVINIILNAVFIPIHAGIGAAIGTVFAQVAVTAVYIYSCKIDLALRKVVLRNVPIIISGAVMYGVIKLFQTTHEMNLPGMILDVIIGGIIFIICIFVLGTRRQDHLIRVIKKSIINRYKRKGTI